MWCKISPKVVHIQSTYIHAPRRKYSNLSYKTTIKANEQNVQDNWFRILVQIPAIGALLFWHNFGSVNKASLSTSRIILLRCCSKRYIGTILDKKAIPLITCAAFENDVWFHSMASFLWFYADIIWERVLLFPLRMIFNFFKTHRQQTFIFWISVKYFLLFNFPCRSFTIHLYGRSINQFYAFAPP